MSWHRLWHQRDRDDLTRAEAPSSRLRKAMRKQMRDDARRMAVPPKKRNRTSYLPREIDEPPPARMDRCRGLPDDLYMPKGWFLA